MGRFLAASVVEEGQTGDDTPQFPAPAKKKAAPKGGSFIQSD
jgi:hypothetical protein